MRILLALLLCVSVLRAADPPRAPVTTAWDCPKSTDRATAFAWLPDGTGLFVGDSTGAVTLWDLATRRATATLPPAPMASAIAALAVSRDGRLVAVADPAAGLRIWDRTMEPDRRITPAELFASVPVEPNERHAVVGVEIDEASKSIAVLSARHAIARVAFDGKAIGVPSRMPVQFGTGEKAFIRDEAAVAPNAGIGVAYYEGHEVDELRVWNFAPGKVAATAPLKELTRPAAQSITADGRRAIVRDLRPNGCTLLLFDVRTLQEIGTLAVPGTRRDDIVRTGFSRDGRLLIVASDRAPATIYDVARLTPVARLETDPATWCLSPDFRRLACGSDDAKVKILDLRAAVDPHPPTVFDPTACWNDLVAADGATALRAVHRLADHPAEAIAKIREQLKPAEKPKDEDLTRWLAALSAPAFADRKAASRKLTAVADAIGPDLEREAGRNTSPETVAAIQAILDTASRSRRKLDGDFLRIDRSVQILEIIGGPAKELLGTYAGGAPGAFLTETARSAMGRMK